MRAVTNGPELSSGTPVSTRGTRGRSTRACANGGARRTRSGGNVDGQMHASPKYTIPLHALAQTPKSATLALWALSAR